MSAAGTPAGGFVLDDRMATRRATAGPDGPIRVLHVVLNIHEGGLERVVGDLVRGLDPARFEQHVLALTHLGRLSKGLDEHARLHVASPLPRWSMIRPGTLARDIREIAPDVVHTHSGVWYKASLAARMAGVRFVVHTDHGRRSPDPWSDRFVDGLAARRTDCVIAVSDELGRQLTRSVVRGRCEVRRIPNGIDVARFTRKRPGPRLRTELGIAAGAPVIGSIGRLYPIKRYDLMIDAFTRLRAAYRGPAAPVLVIAGDGPERGALERMAARPELGGSVHILGWREDVDVLHEAFDVFTMSSRSEGTSIGLLEALSAEICPVVTDVGGNSAVLGEELRHRLCAPEDADALARAWSDALADPDARERDGALGRGQVEARFSLARMVRDHEALYEAGVGAHRRTHATGNG
jgi:glycosyltransferase involved in cell wall biosynthesis